VKEELQTRLLSSLDKVQEYIEATEEFVAEQAPLVAQEIILAGRITHCWFLFLAIIAIGIGIWIARICVKENNKIPEDRHNDGAWIAGSIVSIVAALGVCAVFSATMVPQIVNVWFAPRLYLIQEIGKLL